MVPNLYLVRTQNGILQKGLNFPILPKVGAIEGLEA